MVSCLPATCQCPATGFFRDQDDHTKYLLRETLGRLLVVRDPETSVPSRRRPGMVPEVKVSKKMQKVREISVCSMVCLPFFIHHYVTVHHCLVACSRFLREIPVYLNPRVIPLVVSLFNLYVIRLGFYCLHSATRSTGLPPINPRQGCEKGEWYFFHRKTIGKP